MVFQTTPVCNECHMPMIDGGTSSNPVYVCVGCSASEPVHTTALPSNEAGNRDQLESLTPIGKEALAASICPGCANNATGKDPHCSSCGYEFTIFNEYPTLKEIFGMESSEEQLGHRFDDVSPLFLKKVFLQGVGFQQEFINTIKGALESADATMSAYHTWHLEHSDGLAYEESSLFEKYQTANSKLHHLAQLVMKVNMVIEQAPAVEDAPTGQKRRLA